jgi:hypothetical protein
MKASQMLSQEDRLFYLEMTCPEFNDQPDHIKQIIVDDETVVKIFEDGMTDRAFEFIVRTRTNPMKVAFDNNDNYDSIHSQIINAVFDLINIHTDSDLSYNSDIITIGDIQTLGTQLMNNQPQIVIQQVGPLQTNFQSKSVVPISQISFKPIRVSNTSYDDRLDYLNQFHEDFRHHMDHIKHLIIEDSELVKIFDDGIKDDAFYNVVIRRKNPLMVGRDLLNPIYDIVESSISRRVGYLIRFLPSVVVLQPAIKWIGVHPSSIVIHKTTYNLANRGRHIHLNDNCCENPKCDKWCRKHRLAFKIIQKWQRLANTRNRQYTDDSSEDIDDSDEFEPIN